MSVRQTFIIALILLLLVAVWGMPFHIILCLFFLVAFLLICRNSLYTLQVLLFTFRTLVQLKFIYDPRVRQEPK